MVRVIGIDPGLSATGIGIVCGTGRKIKDFSFGSIKTSGSDSLPDRLHHLFSQVIHVCEKEAPDIMVIEDVFSIKENPKSGILLGKVAGVILLAGSRLGIPIHEISVREAKQVLTGNGRAGKDQLEKAVRSFLNITTVIRPYHASDAVALAIIGVFRFGFQIEKDSLQ
jgi:crossover junction endodeoxyribonuclease RuvC